MKETDNKTSSYHVEKTLLHSVTFVSKDTLGNGLLVQRTINADTLEEAENRIFETYGNDEEFQRGKEHGWKVATWNKIETVAKELPPKEVTQSEIINLLMTRMKDTIPEKKLKTLGNKVLTKWEKKYLADLCNSKQP